MKRAGSLSGLILAALPAAALAAPDSLDQWHTSTGTDHTWPISALMGDDVIAGSNTEVGNVTDVVLGDQGRIMSLIVHSNGNAVDAGYYQVEWPVKLFEPGDVLLSIDATPETFAQMTRLDSPADAVADHHYLASQLLGMGVEVEGNAWEEIENLIVSGDQRINSIVIAKDGADSADYWIPASPGWINAQQVMVVPYAQADIESGHDYMN